MGKAHYTTCTNPDCKIGASDLDEGVKCPHCHKGERLRTPQVPSLIVKDMAGEVVNIIPVKSPYTSVKGIDRYEVVMNGLLRHMDDSRFFIDDSEFTGSIEGSGK